MVPFAGMVRTSGLPEGLQGELPPQRTTRRCSMFEAWVEEPGRTSTAELIGEVLV
jgi:hypothetical protein